MKKNIVLVGIILILIGIGLFVYREMAYQKLDAKRINIHDITGSGAKIEKANVYLNASFIANPLAKIQSDEKNSYYVVFGDDVQYIVYLNNKKASEISNYLLDNPTSTYKIVGKTKFIKEDLESYGIEFVKKWLDANHDHTDIKEEHSHEITKEEFYEYFGYVYLDATISKYSDFKVLTIILYVLFGIGLSIILSKVYVKFAN